MIVLVGYSWSDVLIGMLWVSLILLVLIIGYKRLLRALRRTNIDAENYIVLYSLEFEPAKGELPFYFTADKEKDYELVILDADMNDVKLVKSGTSQIGGNIIRYNSSDLPNGIYFYCVRTDNQKIMKKMTLMND